MPQTNLWHICVLWKLIVKKKDGNYFHPYQTLILDDCKGNPTKIIGVGSPLKTHTRTLSLVSIWYRRQWGPTQKKQQKTLAPLYSRLLSHHATWQAKQAKKEWWVCTPPPPKSFQETWPPHGGIFNLDVEEEKKMKVSWVMTYIIMGLNDLMFLPKTVW